MKTFSIVIAMGLIVASAVDAQDTARPISEIDPVADLIAQLQSKSTATRERATQQLIALGVVAEVPLQQALKSASSQDHAQRIKSILQMTNARFAGEANGWNWIYHGIAHGQSFRALGGQIQTLHIRAAQLNPNRPQADLEVEIRDPTLKKIYARGFVGRQHATQNFTWHQVKLKHRAALAAGKSYVLMFHSQDTSNTNAWLVNQIYRDIYPHGSELFLKHHDFFFRLRFAGGRLLHVGPKMTANNVRPYNSGYQGGTPVLRPLTLQGAGVVPQGTLVKGRAEE